MAARTFSFSYGSITVGGASESTYILDSAIRLVRRYRNLTASCEILLRATSIGSMESARTSLESVFRTPLLTLVIDYQGTTQTYAHSANSGFNQSPTLVRLPDPNDDGLLCRYSVTVSVDLPANRSGDSGLASLMSTVTSGPTEYTTLDIVGEYSALSSNSSLAQYTASIGTLVTALKTEASATAVWEDIMVSFDRDKESKTTSFHHLYRDRITLSVFTLSYGGVVIGDGSYLLDSPIRISRTYEVLIASCDVRIREATGGAVETKRLALETAFRKINETLILTYNSVTYTYGSSGNTGFNQKASIQRIPNEKETELIALYTVSVSVELPADESAASGLVNLAVKAVVGQTDLKSLSVVGEYTALGSNSAVAQYSASIAALIASIKIEFGPTTRWEPINIDYTRDKTTKRAQFSHLYIETIDRENSDNTDTSFIRQAQTRIGVVRDASVELPDQFTRNDIVQVSYSCMIVNTTAVATDETELRRIWQEIILDSIIDRIFAYQDAVTGGNGTSAFSLLKVVPVFNTAVPSISATLEAMIHGDGLITGMLSEDEVVSSPWVNLAVFSGNMFEKITVPQVANAVRSHMVRVMVRGTRDDAISRAIQLLIPFPDRITVGPGTIPIQSVSRYTLPSSEIKKNWMAVLDDKTLGARSLKVEGPKYTGVQRGLSSNQAIYVVTIEQSAEYFAASERLNSGVQNVISPSQ